MAAVRGGLALLLAGYLHQDWPDEHGRVRDAVDAFLDELDEPGRSAFIAEVDGVLAVAGDDAVLRATFDDLGSGYHPPGDGLTHREWLEEVRAMAAARRAGDHTGG